MAELTGILEIVDLFDEPAPGANANIQRLGTDLELAPAWPAMYRFTVAFQNATILDVVVSRPGKTDRVLKLHDVSEGERVFSFVYPVSRFNRYRFRIRTNGAIRQFQVEELRGGLT